MISGPTATSAQQLGVAFRPLLSVIGSPQTRAPPTCYGLKGREDVANEEQQEMIVEFSGLETC